MITLYIAGPAFGLPDASPSGMKTEVHLKMAGLDYRTNRIGFAGPPKGKLPYIDDGGRVVADSTLIRLYLERAYDVDLDRGLSARQRAEAWAIERMLEDHLGWAMAYFRGAASDNVEKGPAHLCGDGPAAIRAEIRRREQERASAHLDGPGIAPHAPEEIAGLGATSIWALAALLGDKPYLMGDEPTAVDATAFSILAHVLAPHFETPLRQVAEGASNLVDYVGRMMRSYYSRMEVAPHHCPTPEALLAWAA